MPTSCCAYGCSNHNLKDECIKRAVSFHTFPSDPLMRNAWLSALRRENFVPSKQTKICSDHFQPECFHSSPFHRKLRKHSVPTIFPYHPNSKSQLKKLTCREEDYFTAPGQKSTSYYNFQPQIVPEKKETQFANGSLKFVGFAPGRASLQSFENPVLLEEISKVQAKLADTCNKIAIIEKRRQLLKSLVMSEPDLSYYKLLTSVLDPKSVQTSLITGEPLIVSSLDPPPAVEKKVCTCDTDSSEGDNSSSDELSNSSPSSNDESLDDSGDDSSLEINLSGLDEPLMTSPLRNVTASYSSGDESCTIPDSEEKITETSNQHLEELPLLEQKSLNSSSENNEILTISTHLEELLASVEKSLVTSPEKKDAASSSTHLEELSTSVEKSLNTSVENETSSKHLEELPTPLETMKFCMNIPSIEHMKENDAAHNYYILRFSNQKEKIDCKPVPVSLLRKIPAEERTLYDRLKRARKRKRFLSRMIHSLRKKNAHYKRKNAALKSWLNQ